MRYLIQHLIVIMSLLLSSATPFSIQAESKERDLEKVAKEHTRLVKQTAKRAHKCLATQKCSEKKVLKMWSKWVMTFGLESTPMPTVEMMGSGDFHAWSWQQIEARAAETGGIAAFRELMQKRKKQLFWCHVKKGALYGATGLLYAGSVAAITTLIVVPGTFLFSIWGLVWLSVPAGANWGTLVLLEAIKGCKVQ